MSAKKIILAAVVLASVVGALLYFVDTGFLMSESPRVVEKGGGSLTDKSDLVRLSNIASGDTMTSPLVVEGEARGYWFFEASFPVRIMDGDGKELGVGVAQAQKNPATGEVNWMTEEFVPFRATVEFKKPQFVAGTLVLEKDNPSGLPEHDDELRVPINFSNAGGKGDDASGKCFVGGCSGQACSGEEGVITTCEFREEYACYKTAVCERQPSGECGWTKTAELKSCLDNARAME